MPTPRRFLLTLLCIPNGITGNDDFLPARGYDAFAFRPAGTSLWDAFNAALAELKGMPQFLAAMAPFGFTQANLPDHTTEALCR